MDPENQAWGSPPPNPDEGLDRKAPLSSGEGRKEQPGKNKSQVSVPAPQEVSSVFSEGSGLSGLHWPACCMHFPLPSDSGGLTFKSEDVSERGLDK